MTETLGALAKIHYGKSPSDVVSTDGEVPVVGTGGIYAQATRALFDQGVVVARKGSLGTPHLLRSPFWPSDTTYAVVPMPGIDIEWLYYCLLHFDLTKLNEATGVPSISRDWLAKTLFHNPGGEQQKRIAAILTSLDTAIEKTEALIEKHQQIKAGLMHDLFTRGVLPNGQLRPPREQAPEPYRETPLGWVPASWNMDRLGAMAKIVSGVTLGAKERPDEFIDAPYLRVANVQDGYLDLAEIKSVRISRKTLEQLRLQPGDVLMNEGGDFDKLGRGAVWAGEIEGCVHQNHVFRVRTNTSMLLPHYLALYSESSFGKKYFVLSSKQSTNLASINSTQLNAYPIATPSVAEQLGIVQRLGGVNHRIGTLRADASKLCAQKLGLMQDLLTGKVPVKIADSEAVPA
jgi:type I restriction enzyme, S subunit